MGQTFWTSTHEKDLVPFIFYDSYLSYNGSGIFFSTRHGRREWLNTD